MSYGQNILHGFVFLLILIVYGKLQQANNWCFDKSATISLSRTQVCIVCWIWSISQNLNNIVNKKLPFLVALNPNNSFLLAFKKFYINHGCILTWFSEKLFKFLFLKSWKKHNIFIYISIRYHNYKNFIYTFRQIIPISIPLPECHTWIYFQAYFGNPYRHYPHYQ